jgi:hypothetical protein
MKRIALPKWFNPEGVLVYDSESDGFVEQASRVHVISIVPIDGHPWDTMWSYWGPHLEDGLARLEQARVIVAHNQVKHDIQLFQKLYPGWQPPLVLDSMLLSQTLKPDLLGGHSIENWARIFGGEQKQEQEDWRYLTYDVVTRCESDTRINQRLIRKLLHDCYLPIDGVDIYNFDFGEHNHVV